MATAAAAVAVLASLNTFWETEKRRKEGAGLRTP